MKSFLSFHFDDADGTLWRGHQRVSLTRKAAALLRCLVDRAGIPVEKGGIMSAVWPDTHVHPDNVKVLVREIRLALGDDPHSPTFIRSDAGHGYTFIAPVADTVNANFIGRSRELAALVDALDGVRAGAPQVLLVAGERGVGKSRLCDVFLRMTSAASALRSCAGECREDAGGDEPLAAVLRALADLERKAPGLVRTVLADHAPSWLARLAPGANVGEGAPGNAGAGEFATVLARLSASVPLVMVIEDLQWADPATLAALLRLSQERGAAKWLLLGTYSPSAGVDDRTALFTGLANQRRTRTVVLGRLTDLHVRRYLDERLGAGRLAGAAAAITAVTGGNPGMLVKVVDELIERGFLIRGVGGWEAALTPAAIEGVLPELLTQTFQAEVDALDASSRTALEIASLAGASFTSSAVADASQTSPAGVERLLAPLARRGHIIRQLRGPAPAYVFRHPAYADLLARRAPFAQQMDAARAFDDSHEEPQLRRA